MIVLAMCVMYQSATGENLTEATQIADRWNMIDNRLDKFWSNQEIIYDYRAEIQVTGSRSVIY